MVFFLPSVIFMLFLKSHLVLFPGLHVTPPNGFCPPQWLSPVVWARSPGDLGPVESQPPLGVAPPGPMAGAPRECSVVRWFQGLPACGPTPPPIFTVFIFILTPCTPFLVRQYGWMNPPCSPKTPNLSHPGPGLWLLKRHHCSQIGWVLPGAPPAPSCGARQCPRGRFRQ